MVNNLIELMFAFYDFFGRVFSYINGTLHLIHRISTGFVDLTMALQDGQVYLKYPPLRICLFVLTKLSSLYCICLIKSVAWSFNLVLPKPVLELGVLEHINPCSVAVLAKCLL